MITLNIYELEFPFYPSEIEILLFFLCLGEKIQFLGNKYRSDNL